MATNDRARLVAVTGGTGFVGVALVARLLADGFSVRALARTPEKLERWNGAVEPTPGALNQPDALETLCDGADAVVNLAALTHALTPQAFQATNVDGAAVLARAARATGARLVHVSSMAARRPDLSPYARSKRESERVVAAASRENPCLSLRMPAIYGPEDLATLPYYKLVKRGFAVEPATATPARFSILHVDDAARALVAAIDAPAGPTYEVGDESPFGHAWRDLAAGLARAFGRRAREIRLPRAALDMAGAAGELAAHVRRRATMTTRGKVAELFHDDWVARDSLFADATAWRPSTPLAEGLARTARWYEARGLL